jgi:hypothetical protein
MRKSRLPLPMLMTALLLHPAGLGAQTPARDPGGVLEQVLPPEVAQQVLQRIADARARELPAAALEHRALELHAKGLPPADIPDAVARLEEAMAKGKSALKAGGHTNPSDDEVEAAGTATANGVDGAAISSLAKSAPSGRSLAVPLTVLTSLIDRGLAADEALSRVVTRLQARASDEQLAALPEQASGGLSHKPETPRNTAPASARPAWVPANGGQGTRPASVPASGTSHPEGRPN